MPWFYVGPAEEVTLWQERELNFWVFFCNTAQRWYHKCILEMYALIEVNSINYKFVSLRRIKRTEESKLNYRRSMTGAWQGIGSALGCAAHGDFHYRTLVFLYRSIGRIIDRLTSDIKKVAQRCWNWKQQPEDVSEKEQVNLFGRNRPNNASAYSIFFARLCQYVSKIAVLWNLCFS